MILYTEYDLGMNVDGTKYVLPDTFQTDELAIEMVKDMFVSCNIPYFTLDRSHSATINEMWQKVRIPCLYPGYDGYYGYELIVHLFKVADGKHSGKVMISLYVETEHGELHQELIDLKVIPELVKALGLCAR
jgi:hypothetical protein